MNVKKNKAVSDYLAEIGRRGGEVKTPKGFATMDEGKALAIRKAGAEAAWAKKRAKKKAGKKAGKT